VAGGAVARLLARTFAGEEVRAVEGRRRRGRRLTPAGPCRRCSPSRTWGCRSGRSLSAGP